MDKTEQAAESLWWNSHHIEFEQLVYFAHSTHVNCYTAEHTVIH